MKRIILTVSALIISLQANGADFTLKVGRPFMFDGVNCHSASLQAAGVMKYPSYVDDEEIRFIFDTQCTQVRSNQAGAIGITGAGTLFSHSFFYLQPNKVFQKSSLQKKTSYEILRGGPVPSAKYYVCEAEPNDCADPQVSHLKKLTDQSGLYYAALLLRADGLKQRDAQHRRLIKIQKATKALRGIPASCRRAVKRIEFRQNSLRAVADRLSGAMYYINQLPRGVGRD